MDVNGVWSTSRALRLRWADGESLLALAEDSAIARFDPPLRLWDESRELESWTAAGTLGDASYNARIELARADGPEAEDCIVRDVRISTELGGETTTYAWRTTFCAGVGSVSGVRSEPTSERWEVVSGTQRGVLDGDALPTGEALSMTEVPDHLDETASGTGIIGHAATSAVTPETTHRPVHVPGSPSMVLTSLRDGPMTALNAMSGEILWTFEAPGSFYGEPVADGQGRLFFGSTDRRLHALSESGLHLWSTTTQDPISARPVVFASRVIFGTEAGEIQAHDVDRGTLAWSYRGSGPIRSDPIADADTLFVATHDGHVTAMDPVNGRVLWEATVSGQVEAPLDLVFGVLFVTTSTGTIHSFDVESGERYGSSDLGHAMNTPYAQVGSHLYAVTDSGGLIDLAAPGHLSPGGGALVGPPIAWGDDVLTLDAWGTLHLHEADGGQRLESWPAGDRTLSSDGTSMLHHGMTGADGYVWFVDNSGALHRHAPERS